MRLLSLSVRNYRIHRDTRIDFDPSRHLIGGVNETGKSTLAEAIHRVLFMRYKAGGDLQKSMVSAIHAGHPEVTLAFEAAGDTWTIEKVFAGSTKGTARLASARGPSFQGDEAEEKLAEITSNPDGAANRENDLSTRWAHLWVWQGKSGEDASTHAAGRRNELTRRLQECGLASVMQSATDEKTSEAVRALHDAIFTKTGVKTGSRLDLAAKAQQKAEAQLADYTAQKARLEAAAADQESATRALAESEAALPGLRAQLATHKGALALARDLRAELGKQKLLHTQAEATLRDLAKLDAEIRRLQAEVEAGRQALAPEANQLSTLAEQAGIASKDADDARTAADGASEALRRARQLNDLANACVARFEKAADHDGLVALKTNIAVLEQSLEADRAALSRLPSISPGQLETLRALESDHMQARSALDAIATGVELLASPQAVLLDGQTLRPDEPRVVTGTSEISLADGTRLRIQPGGGTSLAKARDKADELAKKLAALLDQLALPDSTRAAEVFIQRQTLENKIAGTQSRLKDLGAPGLPEKLSAAKNAAEAALAEVGRRQAALAAGHSPILPGTLAAATAWQNEIRQSLQNEENNEQARRSGADAAHKDSQKKAAAHQKAFEKLEARRRELADSESAARALEKNHGDANHRANAIASATREEAAAKAALDAASKALADLNPERLEQEAARLDRAIAKELEKQQAARERLASAKTSLASDGTSDPEADLLQARARLATASEEHAREKRHADAIALLHRLFTESREAITRGITQPIADRVAGYLEPIFGRGVRIEVDWSEADSKQAQTIHIKGSGMPSFPFQSLSGGAKEQVAAAVRLATAEILAAAHNGCLPILFDDSFAYSDRERIQSLQSMLDLAAARGLQVLVLSCTPADYIGFGASETLLEKPRFAGEIPAAVNLRVNESQNEPEAPEDSIPVPIGPNLAEQFLSALHEAGGKSGNASLQASLCWDSDTYNAVKDGLVASGQITKGQGRGGSVSLA